MCRVFFFFFYRVIGGTVCSYYVIGLCFFTSSKSPPALRLKMDRLSGNSNDFTPNDFQDINIRTDTTFPGRHNQSATVQQRFNSNNMEGDDYNAREKGGTVSFTAAAPEGVHTATSSSTSTTTTNANSDRELNHIKEETKSLAEKLRTHYREGSSAGSKAKTFARGFFQFHMMTFTFMAYFYLFPWALEDYDVGVRVIMNILIVYIFIMIQSNWLLSIITESDLPQNIPELPPKSSELDEATLRRLNMKLNVNKQIESSSSSTSSSSSQSSSLSHASSEQSTAVSLPRIDKYGMIWKYCDICNRFRPPRTYHCKFCRRCILRRDHHCHMIGNCIGHYNQRFFVVLCFYLLIAASISFPITASYLSEELREAQSWTWYILPYTLLLFVFRYVSWKMALLTLHAYLMFIFGVLSLLYWLSQLSLISMGKTLVEVIKQMDVKVSSSLSDNFSVVFGGHWFLSFVLPVPTLFRQTHDGIVFDKVTIYGKKVNDI